MRILLLTLTILCFNLKTFSQTEETITIVSYNLLNFPNGRNDCGANFNVPNRFDTLRKIVSYANADIFVACEIQTEAGADSILTRAFNINGSTNFAMATFHGNTSGLNDLQNSMYYNTNKLTLYSQDIIQTSVRDIDHYVLYVKDPNLGIHHDTVFIEMYMCHLKAGNSSADQTTRAQQADDIRLYMNNRPTNSHHFVCGDMNVYYSFEVAYQRLLQAGINKLNDPINSPGNWTSNSSFAPIHTQSTRSGQVLSCGSTGGLDDRFDHIIVTDNVLQSNDSLKYIVGSYRAIGNDAGHYNQSLISGSNSQYPDSVVNALYYMSDHLPVSLKMKYIYPTDFGLGLTYSKSDYVCPGNSNGNATVNPTLGTGPYTYLWDAAAGNQTTQTATNLSSGTYCVTVTDVFGKQDNVCLNISLAQALNLGVYPVAANSGCDGSATVILGGGVQPYTYSWNDPTNQTTQTATNLCPGTYTCTVTDSKGCSASIQVQILGQLGISELFSANDFQVYPNPTNDIITLKFFQDLKSETINYQLYDVSGKLLKSDNLTVTNQENLTIDLSTFNTGIYFLKIQIESFSQELKVVKN